MLRFRPILFLLPALYLTIVRPGDPLPDPEDEVQAESIAPPMEIRGGIPQGEVLLVLRQSFT